MKRGFTLHEMIISLTILSVALIIAAHFASEQRAFLLSFTDAQTTRGQLAEAVGIPGALLRNADPRAGDFLAGEDSVLELRVTTGVAVVCSSAQGAVVIPRPNEGLEATSAFFNNPQRGDRIDALLADSTGVGWIVATVAAVTTVDVSCPSFTTTAGILRLALDQPIAIPAGAPLRFTRPFRLSHYRSSDGRWYLGGRDWNGEEGQFNAVQPLAGPLAPRSASGSAGLTFEYFDVAGNAVSAPWTRTGVAIIAITARSPRTEGGPGDSLRLLAPVAR
jgi:prepilin-type N-terminal cleavage/methylation domain-containing protein